MKHTYSPPLRFLALVLALVLMLPLSPAVHAAGKVYYPIDMTEPVLASRVTQRVSGGCAVASMATVEAYLYGAVTDEERELVYNALVTANGDDDYAYWGNVGYKTSQDSIDWEAVYNQLAQGYPCIIHRPTAGELGQHWSVVAGYQGSSSVLEPDQFLVVEVNQKSGPGIQTVAQWRGAAQVDRYTWRSSGLTITELPGIRFAVNHPPVVKLSGVIHNVTGTVVSDVKLNRLQVNVTCLTSGKQVYSKTLSPNALSYQMANLDSDMSYSSWGAGQYYLTLHAVNARNEEAMYGRYFEIAADYPAEMPDPVYELAFDAGSGSGAMDALFLHLGDTFTLPACAMAHPEGIFAGWHVQRGDGTWLVDGKQWLTEEAITAGDHSKSRFMDNESGTLDAWWIRDAAALGGYTFVAQWDLGTAPDGPTEPEVPTEPEAPTEPEVPTEPEAPTEPEVPTEPDTPDGPEIQRLCGDSRYTTAFAIADRLKEVLNLEAFDNIIIASGFDFADALSGSYLAAVKQAPILLTNGRNGADLSRYILDNWSGNGTVYILGGDAAVPDEIPEALQQAGIPSSRLFGDSRYETNLAVLEEAGVSGEEILICSGRDFADALSASATGLPILLVNNLTGRLTQSQISFLQEHPENTYTIIGGEVAVSSAFETAIQEPELLGRDTGRIYGTGREETSIRVAETYFDAPARILVAFSRNFPDGLCGGPLAHALGAPLILVNDGREKPAAQYVSQNGVSGCFVLGGTNVVSDSIVRNIFPE